MGNKNKYKIIETPYRNIFQYTDCRKAELSKVYEYNKYYISYTVQGIIKNEDIIEDIQKKIILRKIHYD